MCSLLEHQPRVGLVGAEARCTLVDPHFLRERDCAVEQRFTAAELCEVCVRRECPLDLRTRALDVVRFGRVDF